MRHSGNITSVGVTDVHDVRDLIHGSAAGSDASCIYLESFSFSLLCTIEYTHTVLPNFHIVTVGTSRVYSSVVRRACVRVCPKLLESKQSNIPQ